MVSRHPELGEISHQLFAEVLKHPDEIRRSSRDPAARIFSRWYTDLREGKHIVLVVVTSDEPQVRHWIITAYVARNLVEGGLIWKRV